jgi:hypothetical protein
VIWAETSVQKTVKAIKAKIRIIVSIFTPNNCYQNRVKCKTIKVLTKRKIFVT